MSSAWLAVEGCEELRAERLVNLKTANALGLDVPLQLRQRALTQLAAPARGSSWHYPDLTPDPRSVCSRE
jgi:hypothetical protein